MFYMFRMFESTAALVRMIIEITVDINTFLTLFMMFIFAFANSFYIIARNDPDGEMFTGDTLFKAFIFSYRTGMGDFETDGFEYRDMIIVYFLWFFTSVLILIISLNLLLAIMGDTFDRVQETQRNFVLKEFANIVVENNHLINKKKLFGNAKYIFVIQEE